MLHAFLGSAAIYDARSHRIPNLLILTGYGLGFFINVILEGRFSFLQYSFSLLIPYLLLVLYALGQLGAGDIKCISAMSSIIGLAKTGRIIVLGTLLLGLGLGLRYFVSDQQKASNQWGGVPVAPALFLALILLDMSTNF